MNNWTVAIQPKLERAALLYRGDVYAAISVEVGWQATREGRCVNANRGTVAQELGFVSATDLQLHIDHMLGYDGTSKLDLVTCVAAANWTVNRLNEAGVTL